MQLLTTRHADDGDRQSVTFDVATASGERRLHFTFPAGLPIAPAPAALPLLLYPAMAAATDLVLDVPIEPGLLGRMTRVQDIMTAWCPSMTRVAVSAPPAASAAPRSGGRVGCFFTGGVDSFYTLLKHAAEIDTILYVHGFDLRPEGHPEGAADASLRAQVSRMLHEVARRLGKDVIEIASDLRNFSDPRVPWVWYHGAALAGVAQMVAPAFAKIYVSASSHYRTLIPWGSHPLLDPLWSLEQLAIVHTGNETERFAKVAMLAQAEVALTHLRVCWTNERGAYNCGRCPKCLRTMVALRLCGALDRCETFPVPLDLAAVATEFIGLPTVNYARENLRAAERLGSDRALLYALRLSLATFPGAALVRRGGRLWRRALGGARPMGHAHGPGGHNLAAPGASPGAARQVPPAG
jgi:hypothetical protein